MPDGTITITASMAGESFTNTIKKTADHPVPHIVPLPPATAIEGYTYTDADTITVDLPSGHGLASGYYDVYWSESGVDKIARRVLGVVSSDTLTLDSPLVGDAFPSTGPSDMVVCEEVEINTLIDGDAAEMFTASPVFTNIAETADCSLLMTASGGTIRIADFRVPANESTSWWNGSGIDNPLSGNDITNIYASNQSTTNEATLKLLALVDSTT